MLVGSAAPDGYYCFDDRKDKDEAHAIAKEYQEGQFRWQTPEKDRLPGTVVETGNGWYYDTQTKESFRIAPLREKEGVDVLGSLERSTDQDKRERCTRYKEPEPEPDVTEGKEQAESEGGEDVVGEGGK